MKIVAYTNRVFAIGLSKGKTKKAMGRLYVIDEKDAAQLDDQRIWYSFAAMQTWILKHKKDFSEVWDLRVEYLDQAMDFRVHTPEQISKYFTKEELCYETTILNFNSFMVEGEPLKDAYISKFWVDLEALHHDLERVKSKLAQQLGPIDHLWKELDFIKKEFAKLQMKVTDRLEKMDAKIASMQSWVDYCEDDFK